MSENNPSTRAGESRDVGLAVSTAPDAVVEGGRNLLTVALALAKHKRVVLGFPFLVAICTAGVSLLMPNIYVGTTKILPPIQTQSSAAMMVGQLAGLAAGLGSSTLGLKNPSDLYVGMLKSRTIGDALIERFNLKNVYEKDSMVETRRALADDTIITAGKDGLVTVQFEDEDPKRAAAVANAYVEELDKLTQSLAVTEAAQRRLFFESQLKQAKQDLGNAEVVLRQTQEKTGLIMLDAQGRATIEAIATLKAQIAATEVRLVSMRSFATEQNPEFARVQREVEGLRAQLHKLERPQSAAGPDIFVSPGRVPEAELDYLRGLRDVKYYEALFEMLAKQLEIAKIDESRDAAIVQVVDRAVVPDRKSKPKRAVMVVLAFLVSGLGAALWALVMERLEHTRGDAARASQLAALRRYLAFRRNE